jgi:tripartite-type tricarboxylate transporter receptor subunit TctC
MPDICEKYAQSVVDVAPSTHEELAAYIRNEIAKWKKVAQSAGISIDPGS